MAAEPIYSLRPYQVQDLAFHIANPKSRNLSEPATGKTGTVCVLSYYHWIKHGRKTIWSMPKSLMEKNMDEFELFTNFNPDDIAILETDYAPLTKDWTGPTFIRQKRVRVKTGLLGPDGSPEFKRLADTTKEDYLRTLDRIDEKFGRARLGVFEDRRMRGDIIAWRDEWVATPRTADKLMVMLGTLLGWGVERGKLAINVAHSIPLLHSVDKSDEIWEHRHIRAMVNAPPHVRDALKMAAFTGLRLGDLVKLDWDLHVREKAIVFITKKRKGRAVIPITPTLRGLLNDREWRTGPVIRNSRGKAWTESGLGSVFQKNKPDGFDRTIHDLRGTYVTWLAVMGLTDEEVARIVGWTAKGVEAVRARYVDEQRVIVSLVERLAAVKRV